MIFLTRVSSAQIQRIACIVEITYEIFNNFTLHVILKNKYIESNNSFQKVVYVNLKFLGYRRAFLQSTYKWKKKNDLVGNVYILLFQN